MDYFPSYESVMLSRDTSVWMDDLIHVQPGFVGLIMSRVTVAYVAENGNAAELVGKMHEVIRLTIIVLERSACSVERDQLGRNAAGAG